MFIVQVDITTRHLLKEDNSNRVTILIDYVVLLCVDALLIPRTDMKNKELRKTAYLRERSAVKESPLEYKDRMKDTVEAKSFKNKRLRKTAYMEIKIVH